MALSEKQLKELKNDLQTMKQELEKQISTTVSEEINTDETSFADNHMADAATEYVDRQTEIAEQNLNEEQLKEINEALQRMKNGSYGICLDTGEEIPFERLKAKPYAKRTVQAEEKLQDQSPANEGEDPSRLVNPEEEVGDFRNRTIKKIEDEHD